MKFDFIKNQSFKFDLNGRYEYPEVILANPDKEEEFIMTQLKDLKIDARFNTTSEASFTVYRSYNNIIIPYYDSLVKNKLVYIMGFGWWVIDNVKEKYEGGVPSKSVSLISYEYILNYKGVNLLNGTYKFYDLIDKHNTLLGQLITAAPRWKIGNIDIDLYNSYRTFDVPDSTLYGFLMDNVAKAYEAIFEFDTENMLINANKPKNIAKNTDIMLTFDNVNKSIEIEELSTDVYTVLRVNGADNLSINLVNPLGDNRLFDFSYYKSWLKDKKLVDRINAWEILVEQERQPYAALLRNLKSKNRELLKLQTELRDLQSELNALEIVRKELYDQPEELKKQTALVDAKVIEIKAKEEAIKVKESEISLVKENLKKINERLRYDNYFTVDERLKLDPYLIEAVYTDENFIVTDQMNFDGANGDTLILTTTGTKKIKDLLDTDIVIDEQYIAEQLLEQGKEAHKRLAQPSFSFSLDTTNFLFVEKFLPFIKQLELGSIINIEIKEGDWAYPMLLEISIDYDNPENLSLTFGNRFRLSSEEYTYGELAREQGKVSSQVGTTLGLAAEPVLNGTVSELRDYIKNNLIAANQNIQDTVDNEFVFGGFGLRGRKKDDRYASGFDPHQLGMSNNSLVMTDDNWQSVRLAIGLVDGKYSVVAENIAGYLIAGNSLIIQDGIKGKESTFIVDQNGARLTNASFVLSTSDGKGKITLNPTKGISIETNKGDGLKKVFYVDSRGYLMAVDITAEGGTVGGFVITKDRFYSTAQINNPNSLSNSKSGSNVPVVDLRIDGTGNLGLLSWNLTNARFDGEIYCKSGTIGGWIINSNELRSPFGDYISSDGTGKIGLMTYNQTSATFLGNIYARNLGDQCTTGNYEDGSITGRKLASNYLLESEFTNWKREEYEPTDAQIENQIIDLQQRVRALERG